MNATLANTNLSVEMDAGNAVVAMQRLVYPYVEEKLLLLEARVAAEPPAKNATLGTLVVTVKAGRLNVSWPGLLAGSSLSVEEASCKGELHGKRGCPLGVCHLDYYSYRVTRLASLIGPVALPALLLAITS